MTKKIEWLTIAINPVDYGGDIVCRGEDKYGHGYDYLIFSSMDRQRFSSNEEYSNYISSQGMVSWGKL